MTLSAQMGKYTSASAVLSDDGQYRYVLGRSWMLERPPLLDWYKKSVIFICLNPSTADELRDDATIRRCVGFAKEWRFNHLVMLNLFAFRSTDPKRLRAARRPIGPDNDRHILRECKKADLIVAAWGTNAEKIDSARAEHVLGLLSGYNVMCLDFTDKGHPSHLLYLRSDLVPVTYREGE